MQPTRRGLLKSLAVAPVLLSPTLLAACGAGSSSKAGTLNVGQISDSVAFFPLFIAEKQGFFTDEKLSLGERPRLGTGAKVAAALKSGSIDLGGGVMTDALNLAEIDDQARLTTSLISAYYVDIVVGGSAGKGGGSLEERVLALKGKKIGITGPGSGTEALVTYLFEQAGLDPAKDATLVNLGAVATAAVGALKSGRVDALSFFQPIGQQAEAAGVGSIYISPAAGDVPSLDGDLHGVVFSRQSILDDKADEVAAFQTAIGRALGVIRGDGSRVRDLLGQYLDGTPDAALDKLVPILQKETATTPAVVESQYEVARTFHVQSGLVDAAPSYSTLVPSRFRA
ncbi:hypothetical protein GCM10011519_20300 [Marmoricola endophyticus]|uniref:ABC transporter substrate-binding protein n=1 Tax=Marmoricola endophyticus TaxID=2040280 RepID=A0A917BKY3_9ACTN|nr:ABC transporter substrate-binding protein [Marmoricola endophyticus]GGF46290.1 hypothetical protein GCM10011519_20300 [Marmoricola endophyticus]